MVVIRFDRIKRKTVLDFKCGGCGRRTKRTASAECTVNPFNKKADGCIRTREEVVQQAVQALEEKEVPKLIAEVEKTPCPKCSGQVRHAAK